MPPRRRPHPSDVLPWVALALVVGALLSEGFGLVDAGRRLRAQEAAEAARTAPGR